MKQEMIEEMANDIPYLTLDRTVFVGATETKNVSWTLSEEDNKLISKELISKGWIKPPKDSVVLSKEEYKELKHYEDEMYRLQGVVDQLTNEGWDILDEKEEKIRQSERKETVEKFVNDLPKNIEKYLKENLKENDYIKGKQGLIDFATIIAKHLAKETAKQFGVEIKEK